MIPAKLIGATFLVTGTTVGAGMLALPIITAGSGFLPTLMILILGWAYMLSCAYLLMRACVRLKKDNDLISMTASTLGKPGQLAVWICYLMLLYALIAAYINGGGTIIAHSISPLLGITIDPKIGMGLFLGIFGILVVLQTKTLDVINRSFMLGLIIMLSFVVLLLIPEVNPEELPKSHPLFVLSTITIIVTAFNFHFIIPRLTQYLEYNKRNLYGVMFAGTGIAFIIYTIWIFLIQSVIPTEGPFGLIEILHSSTPLPELSTRLSEIAQSSWVARGFTGFAFFGIITSFLGASLSLAHFLNDGLQQLGRRVNILFLITGSFIPPLLFALLVPKGFMLALNYAGLFVAILVGILPGLMLIRSHDTKTSRWWIGIAILGALFIIGLEICTTMKWLPTPQ